MFILPLAAGISVGQAATDGDAGQTGQSALAGAAASVALIVRVIRTNPLALVFLGFW